MLDSYRNLIDELLGTPSILRTLLDGTSAPPPEVLTLIDELRARDESMLDRLNTILRTQGGILAPLVNDSTADNAALALTGDPAELLSRFDHARGEIVSLLMNLTIRDWGRSAIGDDGQTTYMSDEVENHVDFEEDQLVRITDAMRAG